MTTLDIAHRRLFSQRLLGAKLETPDDVVSWLGAVQAQDYAGAKWALAMRAPGTTDADVEQAFASGAILRTHLLRPTWHFITPADIRWVLSLTAPSVQAANLYMYRKLGLDDAAFRRSNDTLVRALQGGQYLTREALRDLLHAAGVPGDGEFRMGYLMMRAELDGIVCSGPRRGKQFTYALLDERVPPHGALDREEALASLAHRFFSSQSSELKTTNTVRVGETLSTEPVLCAPTLPRNRSSHPHEHRSEGPYDQDSFGASVIPSRPGG